MYIIHNNNKNDKNKMLSNQQLLSNCDNKLGKIEVISDLITLVYSGKDINKKVIENFITEQQKKYQTAKKNLRIL